jgi:hypothetical protein
LHVSVTIGQDCSGAIADHSHGLTVVWDKNMMSRISDLLPTFLEQSVSRSSGS